MKRKMFGGHVHSPSKSLHHSESTCRIQITHQPQRRVAVKLYLRNEKENVWWHVHSPSKSLHHSTSPSQLGESKSLISPSRESPSKLYLRNEKENVWGYVHSPSKSLRHSESTCRIQITHQPQRRVAVKTLSKK